MTQPREHFMRIAIEEARLGAAAGEQPFGSVVTSAGTLICRTHSLKVSTSDTTAHSELLAISAATRTLQARILPVDTVFYCTCEPCPMCCGAILNAGVRTLVIGARKTDVRSFATRAFRFNTYSVETFADMVGWDVTIKSGVLKDECVALYRDAAVELTR